MDRKMYSKRQGLMRNGGGGGVAAALAAPAAPEIPPLLVQRLPITEPRSLAIAVPAFYYSFRLFHLY